MDNTSSTSVRLASAGGPAKDCPDRPSCRHVARLAATSIALYISLVAAGALQLRRDRIEQSFVVDQRGRYQLFRETTSHIESPDERVVLVVGFRLRVLGANPILHRLFQRLCILTTPFGSGFRGFRTKLWLVDPATKNYLGIYKWAGVANAQVYVDALVRVLRPLSTPASVWYEIQKSEHLEPFLRTRMAT